MLFVRLVLLAPIDAIRADFPENTNLDLFLINLIQISNEDGFVLNVLPGPLESTSRAQSISKMPVVGKKTCFDGLCSRNGGICGVRMKNGPKCSV